MSQTNTKVYFRIRFVLATITLLLGVPLLLSTLQARKQIMTELRSAEVAEQSGQFSHAALRIQVARTNLSGPMTMFFEILQRLGLPMPTRNELLYKEAELLLSGSMALLRELAENPEPLRLAAERLDELPDHGRAGGLNQRLRILQRLQLAQTRYLEGSFENSLHLLNTLQLSNNEEDRSYRFIQQRLAGTALYFRYKQSANASDLREAYQHFAEAFTVDPEDRLAARDFRFVQDLAEKLPPETSAVLLNDAKIPPITELKGNPPVRMTGDETP